MNTIRGCDDDMLAREIILENTKGISSESSLVAEFCDEIDQRINNVLVYYPIIDVLKKRSSDSLYSQWLPELSFLLLSYLIYEGKLHVRGISFEEIHAFMRKSIPEVMPVELDPEQVKQLAVDLLDLLQNSGRNFIVSTYSYSNRRMVDKFVKLIEIKQSEDNALLYYITEQGVDFYLKTKEFPEETKVTVNLILFQKQMEKGFFAFAYETVRRLNMEVQKKMDKKETILEALMLGNFDNGVEYKKYHDSIALQFDEESDLFKVAMENVQTAHREYIDRVNNEEASDKDHRAFTLIKIIEREINRAQSLHTKLLKVAAVFMKDYDYMLGVRRKAIFTERFNFQREFEKVAVADESPDVLKYFFEPLLSPNIRKKFNLMRIFEPHRIVTPAQNDVLPMENERDENRITEDLKYRIKVRDNFVFYAAKLVEMLNDNITIEVGLAEYAKVLAERFGEEVVYNGDFISFIIEINRNKTMGEHQKTILFSNDMDQDEELKSIESIFKAAIARAQINGLRKITVRSVPDDDIEILMGLKITNMYFVGA